MTLGKKILKALLILLAGTVLLFLAFITVVYIISDSHLKDVEIDSGYVFVDSQDPGIIERGRHIARTRGCMGCHGKELEGAVLVQDWGWWGTGVGVNLVRYAQNNDPATFEAAVRQGIGSDGRALWSMPAYNFALMSDEDVSALFTFLRSAPLIEKDLPKSDLGWEARWLIFRGQSQHMAEWADRMPPLTLNELDDPQLVRGEYLAKTTCNECHGFDLRGISDEGPPTPDLAIVAAYTDQDFRRLMKHGEGIGGREDLGLMTIVAKGRFSSFTDEELEDLLAYLRTLPAQVIDKEAAWRRLR